MTTIPEETQERLLKHAYLYATFAYEEKTEYGCVLVRDEAIIGVGWNKTIGGVACTAIEMALLLCNHPKEGTLLFTTAPPSVSDAKLLIIAGIDTVIYHKAQRDKMYWFDSEGLALLEENAVEIIDYCCHLGHSLNILFEGKLWTP